MAATVWTIEREFTSALYDADIIYDATDTFYDGGFSTHWYIEDVSATEKVIYAGENVIYEGEQVVQ